MSLIRRGLVFTTHLPIMESSRTLQLSFINLAVRASRGYLLIGNDDDDDDNQSTKQ